MSEANKRQMKSTKVQLSPECKKMIAGIRDAQDIINGKWKISIISGLFYEGTMRFMELRRHVGNIAPKVLSQELKDLELNHLIKRTVCNTQPITVEYELTSIGRSFNSVMEALGAWGIAYRESILNQQAPSQHNK